MREALRKLLGGLGLFLMGTSTLAAPPGRPPQAGGGFVRMSVEIQWRLLPNAARAADESDLEVHLTEGRIVEAVEWPENGHDGGPEPAGNGWRLGAGSSGRVRARIEAPIGATMIFRGLGPAVNFPLLAVLEGPQRSAPPVPVEITVQRLPWDSLSVDLERGDGTAEPGAAVPVRLGYNILTPEPTQVAVHCQAELRPLRGGEAVWRQESHEVVSTNVIDPPRRSWQIPAPLEEGTYVLQFDVSWKPVEGLEGSLLRRWLQHRFRKAAPATSSTRRVVVTVIAEGPSGAEKPANRGEWDVERVDLTRLRGQRPSAGGRAPVVATGATAWAVPEAALVKASEHGPLYGLISRSGSDAGSLPPADATGLAWSAVGLKVPHPGRPHRLTLTVTGGHPAALGVALIDPAEPAGRHRLLLDACASGPPVLGGGPLITFSWLVWPDDSDPVLVLVNRDAAAPVQVGMVTLTELAELPPGPPLFEPKTDRRGLGLYLAGSDLLDRFGGRFDREGLPSDDLGSARNLARYLVYCGASSVVLPEGLSDRTRRRALGCQAAEDAVGPDRLDVLLRILSRQGCSAWLELNFDGALPGLPAPDSPEALERGLVRLDRHGQADEPAYHALHPEVRAAMKRRVAEAAAARRSQPGLTGLLIRLGPGPTLLGSPDTGLDDATFDRFVRETFPPDPMLNIPGLGTTDPQRFAARADFFAGRGRMPWHTWRSRAIASLYAELAESAQKAAPGTILAVVTPGLQDGPVGYEARRLDLSGLDPSQAWRAVGLDLSQWPTGGNAPVVLRGVALSTDDLAHDLATSPELDAEVAARAGGGLLIDVEGESLQPGSATSPTGGRDATHGRKHSRGTGLRLTALPLSDGSPGDELMGHALAALDAHWVMMSVSAVAGHEDRVRGFARVFRALPAATAAVPPLERQPFGVAVRTLPGSTSSYVSLANDTPYPIRLETILGGIGNAPVDDLGRGLRLAPETVPDGSRLVLDLVPFGVAAIRVGSPQLKVGAIIPYPSPTVLADLQAQCDEVSTQLSRLSQIPARSALGPPNPGFEPPGSSVIQTNWQLVGGMGNALEIDPNRPHSGRGSLHVNVNALPAAVVSENFVAKGHGALTVRAWFRCSEPEARVRVWVEGEGAGHPYVRWSELTVQPDWTAHTIRAPEIPAGGLDSVRLRFELLTAGSLWVDDVNVAGEALTEAERATARRVLMAALHAYREQRYADFARLAGSHWARAPGIAGDRVSARAGSDRGEMIRTGKATALPSNSLLR